MVSIGWHQCHYISAISLEKPLGKAISHFRKNVGNFDAYVKTPPTFWKG
jgi:hypothetical protein